MAWRITGPMSVSSSTIKMSLFAAREIPGCCSLVFAIDYPPSLLCTGHQKYVVPDLMSNTAHCFPHVRSCLSSTSSKIVPHWCTTCSGVLAGRFPQKREGKCASHSFDTLDPDLPPLLFDELRRQIESQSQPRRIRLARIADAIEPFEDPGLLIGRDTSPAVLYPHCHQFFGDQTAHANGLGFRGIFDRVAQQVRERLP